MPDSSHGYLLDIGAGVPELRDLGSACLKNLLCAARNDTGRGEKERREEEKKTQKKKKKKKRG
jgi:hypothetical protein